MSGCTCMAAHIHVEARGRPLVFQELSTVLLFIYFYFLFSHVWFGHVKVRGNFAKFRENSLAHLLTLPEGWVRGMERGFRSPPSCGFLGVNLAHRACTVGPLSHLAGHVLKFV